MKAQVLGLLLSIAALSLAHGTTFLGDYANATNGVALAAGFIPDSSRVIVGEPLFLTFVLSNRSGQPFQFSHVRNEILAVTATDEHGQPVKSRYYGMDANGRVSQETVPPGKSYTARIFLNERCVFDQPGDYTVTCRCDFRDYLKHTAALGQPVTSSFKLTVLPVDPARITQIIETWRHVVEINGALGEAATALAEVNDPRTIPPLAELLAKAPGNYTAVNALARFTNDAAADALMVVLRQGEDHVAGLAGAALRKTHQNDRAARALLPGLTNSEANVRLQAARAVSWTGSELGFAPLGSLLQDASNSVRYAAAEAIGRLGDARSFGVLTNCLSNSDFALRIAAVNGLRALGRPVRAEWVKPMILSDGENVRTFYEAIDLLRIYGGDEAAPGLASCVAFNDPSVRHDYNFRLMLALEFSLNGPKYYYQWHHDPNRDGTEQELADNRRILSELKTWLDKQHHQ
ncbi:MAG: HEAT repeat domain-containing protein [Limisphaerales bacterium]